MNKEQVAIATALLTTFIYFLPNIIQLLFPDAELSELVRMQKLVEQFVLYLLEYLKGLVV